MSSTVNKSAFNDKSTDPSNSSKSSKKSVFSWKDLSKEKRKLFSAYFNAATQASELKEVIQRKHSGQLNSATKCDSYIEWQAACAKRNAAAYHLKPFISDHRYREILSEKVAYYIRVQAGKHEEIIQREDLSFDSTRAIEEKVAMHLESLLHKLFPDTPVVKVSNNYRIGRKGSLSVTCSGPRIGQFYDFEHQEGGGPLQLIEKELKLNKVEAKEWALEFLGETSHFKNQLIFSKASHDEAKEEVDWIPIKPDPKIPAPKFEELGKLHHYYEEVMRHPYYDKEGNLLYYVLRLENQQGEKITPPLSYGKFSEEEKPSWQLKGYKSQNGKHPLYGLEKLESNLLATVVIVEGEKAADFGAEKFLDPDNHICLSWPGGASSVSKADWSDLEGRKVLIWGDYDAAGIRAQHEVCEELKKLDNVAVKAINHDLLNEKDFPNKWDLADPLPERVSKDFIDYVEKSGKSIVGNFSEIERQTVEKIKEGSMKI